MSEFKKEKGGRNESIAILSVFIILALFMVAAAHYGTKTLSAVRANISAEGLWTKHQKEATNHLISYTLFGDPVHYEQFNEALEYHKGVKKARLSLMEEEPDAREAEKGLLSAGIHPGDADLIIWLGLNFRGFENLQEAFGIWARGDSLIADLDRLGAEIHQSMQRGEPDLGERNRYIRQIISVDQSLTRFENNFSEEMADMARWVRWLIFWGILGSGAILILSGYLITRYYIREVDTLNRQLAESESLSRKVLEHSRDVIYQIDLETGEYVYMSPYAETQLGYPAEKIMEEGRDFILSRIHPEDLERMKEEAELMEGKKIKDRFSGETEFRIKRKDGRYIWVSNQRSLVKDENGVPKAVVGSVRDISDRKKHEVETEKSLKEKRTLLEEIHHRVKNNLAVVSSILELQKHEPNDVSLEEVLEDTQARIQSIAMIHEKLYKTETLSDIDIREYIEDFSRVIRDAYNISQKDIDIQKELESFSVEITKAVPLGLIFNELLNNAFKHGFDGVESGRIRITLAKEGESARLSVEDDGKPLPDDFTVDESQSLGMTLVKTLVSQLEGELEISQNEWTKFEVTFPLTVS